MKFAIFGNTYQAKKSSYAERLFSILTRHGAGICICREFYRFLTEELHLQLPASVELFDGDRFEADMVISLGWVKDQKWDALLEEIKAVKAACHGKLLKVIIETCLLTEEEKIKMCEIVSQSGADFIKTSTGFGGGGATREDVALMKAHVAPHVQIKAAGGIASLPDAEDFIALGASRLGTSRVVKAVKAQEG